MATARSMLPELPALVDIIFCCFSAADLAVYEKALVDDFREGAFVASPPETRES